MLDQDPASCMSEHASVKSVRRHVLPNPPRPSTQDLSTDA